MYKKSFYRFLKTFQLIIRIKSVYSPDLQENVGGVIFRTIVKRLIKILNFFSLYLAL